MAGALVLIVGDNEKTRKFLGPVLAFKGTSGT